MRTHERILLTSQILILSIIIQIGIIVMVNTPLPESLTSCNFTYPSNIDFYFMCLSLPVCMHVQRVCTLPTKARRGQWIHPLELELQRVASCHVDAGN